MSLVFLPFTLINVTVFVKQAAKVIGLVVIPVALVQATVRPDLNALSLSYLGALTPLTNIARAIIKANHWAALQVLKCHFELLLLRHVYKGSITVQHLL